MKSTNSFEALQNNLFVKAALAVLVFFSTAAACGHVIPHTDVLYRVAAMLLSAGIITGMFLYTYANVFKLAKSNRKLVILALFLAACFSYGSYVTSGFHVSGVAPLTRGALSYFVGFPATVLVMGFILHISCIWTCDLKARLDATDIKICVVAEIIFCVLMAILFIANHHWYTQFDNVYSLDSFWCIDAFLKNVDYYEVRHPLLSLIAYPVWATAAGFSELIMFPEVRYGLCAGIVQFLNITMLVYTGAMIKAMSNNRNCLILFFAMFSTLLFVFVLEKLVLSVFFVVATVYLLLFHKKYAPVGYVLASGVLLSNMFLFLSEFFVKGSVQEKLRRMLYAIIIGIIFIICSGHGAILNVPQTLADIRSTQEQFGGLEMGIFGRVLGVLNLFQAAFTPLPAAGNNGHYFWTDANTTIAPFAIPIIVIMLVGIVVQRHAPLTKIAATWLCLACILFIPLNWVPNEAPQFALLFSWAIVVLFAEGLQFLAAKVHLDMKYVTIVIAIACLCVSVAELQYINAFLLESV